MKRRSLTFTIQTNQFDNGERVWEKTARYSKMRHLIITRAINETGYAITHVMSGLRVGKGYPNLAQARIALSTLLHMADWKLESDAYYHDNVLRDKILNTHARITSSNRLTIIPSGEE